MPPRFWWKASPDAVRTGQCPPVFILRKLESDTSVIISYQISYEIPYVITSEVSLPYYIRNYLWSHTSEVTSYGIPYEISYEITSEVSLSSFGIIQLDYRIW